MFSNTSKATLSNIVFVVEVAWHKGVEFRSANANFCFLPY
jgi:hypothetical protein